VEASRVSRFDPQINPQNRTRSIELAAGAMGQAINLCWHATVFRPLKIFGWPTHSHTQSASETFLRQCPLYHARRSEKPSLPLRQPGTLREHPVPHSDSRFDVRQTTAAGGSQDRGSRRFLVREFTGTIR